MLCRRTALSGLGRTPRLLPWLGIVLLLLASACNDDSPTAPSNPSPPSGGGSNPPPTAKAFIRAAQLTEDARTVDLVLNGSVVAGSISYPGTSPYAAVDPGEYRVQFRHAGSVREVLVETTLTLTSGQAVTVAVVGPSVEIVTVFDPAIGSTDRAQVRLWNAVFDYPKPLDLKVRNGPYVVQNVGYTAASGYESLIAGLYDFEIRRGGSTEIVTTSTLLGLSPGQGYTVFVVGTLRRDDIEVFVASDSR